MNTKAIKLLRERSNDCIKIDKQDSCNCERQWRVNQSRNEAPRRSAGAQGAHVINLQQSLVMISAFSIGLLFGRTERFSKRCFGLYGGFSKYGAKAKYSGVSPSHILLLSLKGENHS